MAPRARRGGPYAPSAVEAAAPRPADNAGIASTVGPSTPRRPVAIAGALGPSIRRVAFCGVPASSLLVERTPAV